MQQKACFLNCSCRLYLVLNLLFTFRATLRCCCKERIEGASKTIWQHAS